MSDLELLLDVERLLSEIFPEEIAVLISHQVELLTLKENERRNGEGRKEERKGGSGQNETELLHLRNS